MKEKRNGTARRDLSDQINNHEIPSTQETRTTRKILFCCAAMESNCPLFVYRRCFFFIDLLMKHTGREEMKKNPIHTLLVSCTETNRKIYKFRESVLKPVSKEYSRCAGGVHQLRHGQFLRRKTDQPLGLLLYHFLLNNNGS